jgi:hypothetical protein
MKKAKYISFAGEQMPVNFGMQQSINYCQIRDITIGEMSADFDAMSKGKTDGSELRDLIWSALKDGARKEKKPFDLTPEDVSDIIEEMSAAEIETFTAALMDTMPKMDASVKKKQTAASLQ